MTCPVCFSKGKPISRLKSDYSRCLRCKTIFSESVASQDQLFSHYESYYTSSNLEVPKIALASLKKSMERFSKYRTNLNTICDIGFGAGAMLQIAQETGWKCAGSEYSSDAVAKGRKYGWEVHLGDMTPDDLPGPFDVLTIVETLEHVQDPSHLLQQALVRLRSGGFIYGTTPNSQSVNAYILRSHWSVITFPEHPVLLSRKALKTMLKELGFVQISVRSRGFNPYDLISKASSKLFVEKNNDEDYMGRVEYGYRLNTNLSKNSVSRMFKSLANLFLGLSNRGDSLVFTAVKS
jgi:SAM-dependent methyltransferase